MDRSNPTNTGRSVTLILWLFAAALLALVGWRLRPPAPPFMLDRRVHGINFRHVPRDQALERLGAAIGAKRVVIDRKALKELGIDSTQQVDLREPDATVAEAINRFQPSLPASIVAEPVGDELHIVKEEDLPLVLRTYDVSDLIASWRRWPMLIAASDAEVQLNSTSNNQNQNPQYGGGIGASGGLSGVSSPLTAGSTTQPTTPAPSSLDSTVIPP